MRSPQEAAGSSHTNGGGCALPKDRRTGCPAVMGSAENGAGGRCLLSPPSCHLTCQAPPFFLLLLASSSFGPCPLPILGGREGE